MKNFNVSVIIPVYNARPYLKKAVESAHALQEVWEIILIEDNSPDNSYELCLELAKQYKKIRLYTHFNRENRGPGESRNLGIEKSTQEYIAFLDADDWYLPNRFERSKEIFESDDSVDGVYEATGFYNEATMSLDTKRLTTVKDDSIAAEDLLFNLLLSNKGRFTTDAITLKKSILQKSSLFDTSLRLHQDTHLWLKLAHVGKLVPGKLKQPVAIRRQHALNRIQHSNKTSRKLLCIKSFEWFEKQNQVDPRAYRIVFNRYVGSLKSSILTRIIFTIVYLAMHPQSIKKFI